MRRDHSNAATCHHYSPNTSFVIGLVFMSCLVILLLLPMASFAFRTTSFTNILSFSNDFLQLGIFVSIFTIGLFTLNQVETVLFDNHFVQNFFLTNNKTILLFLIEIV